MTKEQARELYGDSGSTGYVNCYDCPLDKDHNNVGYNKECPNCKDGLENCWEAIAKYMTEKEFTGCDHCVHECVSMFDEPCQTCKHNIPPVDPEYETTLSHYVPKEEGGEVKPKEDVVNHPSHYTNGGMECIDEMILIFGKAAVMNFCLCNVWKYRKRALHKNGQEDLDKADWYMNKYKELKEEKVKENPFSFIKEGVTYGAK